MKQWLAGIMLCLLWLQGAQAETLLSHGRFERIHLYSPASTRQVVILLSGADGWNAQAQHWGQALAAQDTLVIGVESPALLARMAKDDGDCSFAAGDLENLAHFVQAYLHLPDYRAPWLAGLDNGAALAFASLSQAPVNTFAGLLTSGFCPQWRTPVPLCRGDGLQFRRESRTGVQLLPASAVTAPWLALPSMTAADCPAAQDPVWQSHARVPVPSAATEPATALAALVAAAPRSAEVAGDSALAGLPVQEVPAKPPASNTLALFLSGDGGWAGLDQEVAAALAGQGITVVGWDSLRYFWTTRTPEGLAADADRILRHYLQQGSVQRVMLIGYSQGADVLPFLVNRLSADTRQRLALVVLMGLEKEAAFEFHLSNWISASRGLPVLPEIARFGGFKTLCLYGEDEEDSACPAISQEGVQVVKLAGGHHFDGAYDDLARRIRAALP